MIFFEVNWPCMIFFSEIATPPPPGISVPVFLISGY